MGAVFRQDFDLVAGIVLQVRIKMRIESCAPARQPRDAAAANLGHLQSI